LGNPASPLDNFAEPWHQYGNRVELPKLISSKL